MESGTIRKAEAPDIDDVVRMHLSLQQHLESSNSSIWKHTDDKKRSLKQQYTEHLVYENSLVLVADVDAKVVGFLFATTNTRTEYVPSIIGSLSSIYVERNYRRRGIGSRLIREACRFFSSKNAEHIYVRYVVRNVEGEGFWRHLGFKPILITAGTLTSKLAGEIDSH